LHEVLFPLWKWDGRDVFLGGWGFFFKGCFLNGMVEKDWVVIKGGGSVLLFLQRIVF